MQAPFLSAVAGRGSNPVAGRGSNLVNAVYPRSSRQASIGLLMQEKMGVSSRV